MVMWSDLARDDLRKIHDYIAADSGYYAKKVVHTIIENTDNLDQYPEMGRVGNNISRKITPYRLVRNDRSR
ncbi:type II toxin-antitoxin system RelE/ParE family toxin [bacterium]|nr:type II toxin-antitoxin system RelE/ParE family toxin [bacterium]